MITAVIMKMLDERGESASPAGQRAVSILLLEDLSIIPLLALARRRGRLATLVEHLHDHGRGRQHEAHRANQGHGRRPAERHGHSREQRATGEHLREAETEDVTPQGPELGRAHLEPDQEQEQHHAEFGDVQDRFGVVEQPEPERPDQQAGAQVTQHGAKAELAEDRHGNDGGGQQDHRVAEPDACRFCRQARPPGRGKQGRYPFSRKKG
jgi:hypothetical protein